VAAKDLDARRGDAEGFGKEGDDGFVGGAGFGGLGDVDFEAAGVFAGNAIAGRVGDDFES
jgi:hypothetical protein